MTGILIGIPAGFLIAWNHPSLAKSSVGKKVLIGLVVGIVTGFIVNVLVEVAEMLLEIKNRHW